MSAVSGMPSLRVGDWVEVKSAEEILASLNGLGEMERMPFMPEMLPYVGRRFRVSAVAHKTCDTVNRTGGRAVKDAVHLEDLRCDGSAHGGCQATCLLFWKSAWLRPVAGASAGEGQGAATETDGVEAPALLTDNTGATRADGVRVHRCQATTLPGWSQPLKWWDVRQYWRDVATGNAPLKRVLTNLFLASVYRLRRLPVGYRASCRLYEWLHELLKGQPDPHGTGSVPKGAPTPDLRSDLRPGEIVEIRDKEAIFRTVNDDNRNRGLQIDEEMTRYCGGRYRVRSRVTQIINEQTGEMMHFKNPCIVLDGVDCLGEYADRRLMCPRRITTYWREIWLKRVDDGAAPTKS